MNKELRACDPTWNHLARSILLYILPLILLGILAAKDLILKNPDFWCALFIGFIIPYLNTSLKGGRHWAIKDFQDKDNFIWSLSIIHAGFWCLSLAILPYTYLAVLMFVILFLIFDFFMLKYDLLKVYCLKKSVLENGASTILMRFALIWWTLLGSFFYFIYLYFDSFISKFAFSVVFVICIQFIIKKIQNKYSPPEDLSHIKDVAVIGAGFSGVYATKWIKESGLNVDCYEKTDSIGGVWSYSDDKNEAGSVFKNTRATSSKHFLHAMDFRAKEELPEFPHHTQVKGFLEDYINQFNLSENINLNREITFVEKKENKWILTFNHEEQKSYDAIVISAGPQGIPRVNDKKDEIYKNFTGQIIHAAEYKDEEQFQTNERVLIVGAGESSADIVVEAVQKKSKVHWSAHNGQWYADRHIGPFPADHFMGIGIRAFLGKFYNIEYIYRRFIVQILINFFWGRGGHGVEAWRPQVPYLHQFLNKSRDGILEIYKGNVLPHGKVIKIIDKTVSFEDGTTIEVDKIVLATGYTPNWPFLKKGPQDLFKLVFNTNDPTMAFNGLARPVLGSITSLAEIQARWIANVFSSSTQIPNESRRESIIYEDLKTHLKRFKDTSSLKVLRDQVGYADELASFMNLNIKWCKLFFSSPKNFFLLLWSPWIAFRFQIHNDDIDKQQEAFDNIRSEMPNWRHPIYVLARISLITFLTCVFLLILALILYPLEYICFSLAGILFILGIYTRMRDNAVFTAKGT